MKNISGQCLRLIQTPIPALESLRTQRVHWENQVIVPATNVLAGVSGQSLEITGIFDAGTASEFGIRFHQGADSYTTVGYNAASVNLFVDRLNSGHISFHPSFPAIIQVPLPVVAGQISIHLFLDWSSFEVFGDDGEAAVTSQIFPIPGSSDLQLYRVNGQAKLVSLEINQIGQVWPDQPPGN